MCANRIYVKPEEGNIYNDVRGMKVEHRLK